MHVNDYFHQVEQTIESCPAIIMKEVSYDQRTSYIGLIKGYLTFDDASCLYFKEFIDTEKTITKYKYGYHYQQGAKVIFRYDNYVHSSKSGIPIHHKHVFNPPKNIGTNIAPTLASVLKEIISLMP